MQPAFDYFAVKAHNEAAPYIAAATVSVDRTVELYIDYYGTVNARLMAPTGPLDTQHNGGGWTNRNARLFPNIGKKRQRRLYDEAALGLSVALGVKLGHPLPKGVRFCTICGTREPQGMSCSCHDNHSQ